MNRTILICIAAALLLIGLGIAIIVHFVYPTSVPPSAATSTSTFPISNPVSSSSSTQNTSSNGGSSVKSSSGTTIQTRDFLSDSGVIHNPYNTSDYDILVGHSDPSASVPPYEIDYSAKDQSFGITLYQEPLGTTRLQAQADLMQRLGISSAQMCNLNYVLATGPGVNDIYAGKNLEFSYCPGATTLPN